MDVPFFHLHVHIFPNNVSEEYIVQGYINLSSQNRLKS